MAMPKYRQVRVWIREDALEVLRQVRPVFRENGLPQQDFLSDAIILAARRVEYENGTLRVQF